MIEEQDLNPQQKRVLDYLVADVLDRYKSGLSEIERYVRDEDFQPAKEKATELAGYGNCTPCAEEMTRLHTKIDESEDVCRKYPWMSRCIRDNLTTEIDQTRRLFVDGQEPEGPTVSPEDE